ncbi:hypothetical protein BLA29_003151 [Euroglyphus maynei]|uniref:PiggyBac transposable element-derived protein domain-containing protein n=1 Tax=Euroglyphus maynei TaxID=6958 RepID=A0A1Y3B2W9_EURMA|nr:hypothetical protein BLA29_003151 [Euroglyphus maynei]
MSSVTKIEKQMEKIYLNDEETEEETEIDSEVEDAVISDIEDDEENSDCEEDNFEDNLKRKFVLGKNGYRWFEDPFVSKTTRIPSKNIIRFESGPKGPARGQTSELELFDLFITKDMIDIIVLYTNKEIENNINHYQSSQRYINPTDNSEIRALFGVLYMAGKSIKKIKNQTWSYFTTKQKAVWTFLISSAIINPQPEKPADGVFDFNSGYWMLPQSIHMSFIKKTEEARIETTS